MSYKDYSKKAVKEIMTEVMQSQKQGAKEVHQTSGGLTLDELIEIGGKVGVGADDIRKAAYEYDHPTTIKNSGTNSTHAFVEKPFESNLTEDVLWSKILNDLGQYFLEEPAGKVKLHPTQKMWTHINHANQETVVSLSKYNKMAKLRISKRVGFWSSPFEGILHGAYSTLILFGFIYAVFKPSLVLSIGILTTIWTLAAITVYILSTLSRRKKLEGLKTLARKIVEKLPSSSENIDTAEIEFD